MTVNLDIIDLLALVMGTQGPNSYDHPFEEYGSITGFPNEKWQWNRAKLSQMNDAELWKLYNDLKTFNLK